MVDGRNTTDESVLWMPGEAQARDAQGRVIDSPQSPTVDADADMNDHGQVEDVVDQQQENAATGTNDEPPAATSGTATG